MVTTPTQIIIGEVRAAMARRGMKQADLAQRMGVSAQWVHNRLSGKVGVGVEDLAAMAQGIGTTLATLLRPLVAEGDQLAEVSR